MSDKKSCKEAAKLECACMAMRAPSLSHTRLSHVPAMLTRSSIPLRSLDDLIFYSGCFLCAAARPSH
jgi:hypothetical protein